MTENNSVDPHENQQEALQQIPYNNGDSLSETIDAQPIAQPDPALYSPTRKSVIGKMFAPVAGFGVTFTTIFRKNVVDQYLPSTWSSKEKNRAKIRPRYHGIHKLNRYADGLEKCVGCELCAWACPADAIFVEAAPNTPDEQYSPGERYGRVYQINYLRCVFCGYCIQACPTRALTMSNECEIAAQHREDLIYEKHDILRPLAQGMLSTPHPMAEGTADTDYYEGKVHGPTQNQIDWVREHRPNDPSLAAFAGRQVSAASTPAADLAAVPATAPVVAAPITGEETVSQVQPSEEVMA